MCTLRCFGILNSSRATGKEAETKRVRDRRKIAGRAFGENKRRNKTVKIGREQGD